MPENVPGKLPRTPEETYQDRLKEIEERLSRERRYRDTKKAYGVRFFREDKNGDDQRPEDFPHGVGEDWEASMPALDIMLYRAMVLRSTAMTLAKTDPAFRDCLAFLPTDNVDCVRATAACKAIESIQGFPFSNTTKKRWKADEILSKTRDLGSKNKRHEAILSARGAFVRGGLNILGSLYVVDFDVFNIEKLRNLGVNGLVEGTEIPLFVLAAMDGFNIDSLESLKSWLDTFLKTPRITKTLISGLAVEFAKFGVEVGTSVFKIGKDALNVDGIKGIILPPEFFNEDIEISIGALAELYGIKITDEESLKKWLETMFKEAASPREFTMVAVREALRASASDLAVAGITIGRQVYRVDPAVFNLDLFRVCSLPKEIDGAKTFGELADLSGETVEDIDGFHKWMSKYLRSERRKGRQPVSGTGLDVSAEQEDDAKLQIGRWQKILARQELPQSEVNEVFEKMVNGGVPKEDVEKLCAHFQRFILGLVFKGGKRQHFFRYDDVLELFAEANRVVMQRIRDFRLPPEEKRNAQDLRQYFKNFIFTCVRSAMFDAPRTGLLSGVSMANSVQRLMISHADVMLTAWSDATLLEEDASITITIKGMDGEKKERTFKKSLLREAVTRYYAFLSKSGLIETFRGESFSPPDNPHVHALELGTGVDHELSVEETLSGGVHIDWKLNVWWEEMERIFHEEYGRSSGDRERNWQIFCLYYRGENQQGGRDSVPMAEIGEKLGVTESRISQIMRDEIMPVIKRIAKNHPELFEGLREIFASSGAETAG